MNNDLVEIIKDVYLQAVASVLPATVISNALRLHPDGRLNVGDWDFDIMNRQVYAIAIGKASVEMTAAVETVLNERLHGGIVVTKTIADDLNLRSSILQGSHPVPDDRSLAAGDAVLRFASEIPSGALVLCLISGGGSALIESLHPGVSLKNLQDTTRALLRAGASIHELNAVRARLSEIKAGGLLARLEHAEVVNLIISDVLGDDLSTIASGPTVPRSVRERGEDVLVRFGVEFALPDEDGDRQPIEPRTIVLGNLSAAIDAACEAARGHGLSPFVVSRSLTGEARHVATTLASIVADTRAGRTSLPSGSCIIAGGETTVAVRGDGTGGCNTEGALAAAIRLQGVDGVAMGFLATDGDDAETNVAGAIVTGKTISDENAVHAERALDQNDTFTFLRDAGAAWGTGATGTNVNDLVIGIAR